MTATVNGRPKKHDRSEVLDLPPAMALESEAALLSSVIYGGRINPDITLAANEFHDLRNAALWQVLNAIDADHGRIDSATIISEAKLHRRYGSDGFDKFFILEIATAGGSVDRQLYHARQIHEAFLKRTIGTYAERLIQKSRSADSLESMQELLDELDLALATDKGTDNAITYPAMTCAKLMTTQFVIRFYVARILAAGQPLILAGPKKAMKTTLLVALMLSLATGMSFLGCFEVFSAVAVGMMTGESGLATIKETIARIAFVMGVDPATITNIVISDKIPQLADLRHLDAIRAFITAHGLKVLIVDPAYMAMSGAEAGNLFVQGQLLRGISELCQELDCTLILCHHTKRNTGRETFDPPELEDIAWAGFQEWARQWLLIGRREAHEPGSGVHRLWLTAGGSIGHGGRWGLDISEGTYDSDGGRFWQVDVIAAADVQKSASDHKDQAKREREAEKAAADLETDRKELVKVLARAKSPKTKSDLRPQIAASFVRFNRAFASLTDDGTFQPVDVTKGNNRHYDAWKLRET